MSEQTVTESQNGVVEGTATELVPAHVATPAPLFPGAEPADVVTKATGVADALADVIAKKRLFVQVQGKSHVLVEGWQLLGTMLGVTAVCTHTEEVPGGFKATVEARTADGRVVGRADAMCTKDEKRGPWKNADDYARLSMAQTRATSKALKGPLGFIVSLAGYEGTPAEEMTFAEQQRPAEAPQDAGPAPDTITKAKATELFERAHSLGLTGEKVSMWLTQAGVEHDRVQSKSTAITALRNLTATQAEAFEGWLSDTADAQAEHQEALEATVADGGKGDQ